MEEIYRLGKHEFATREEWEGAKRDLEKVETIVKNLDIDDPDVAEDVYHFIREGKVSFESKIGTAFFCDISDRVAQHFEREIERGIRLERRRLRKEKEQNEQEQKWQERKEVRQAKMFRILGIICIALSMLCLAFYMIPQYMQKQAVKKQADLARQRMIAQALDWYAAGNDSQTPDGAQQPDGAAQTQEPQAQQVLPEYSIMHKQYPDLAGWIAIDGTKINLPVMQTSDNAYYLDKDVNGDEDVNGTLFLDCRNDIRKPSTNLIIYGHNMKSGAMFGGLKEYLDESYFLSHNIILFDTIYERQTYQIVAVCLSDVGGEGSYRYYNFIDAESDADFDAFLGNIRSCAVYDKTQDVTKSDSLLTLSTCNNYVEDGRLFLVAKKLQ